MKSPLPLCRTLLFVPGNRPDRFDKALNAGADFICIDLEDAILPAQKDIARQNALDYYPCIKEHSCTIAVRINGLDTQDGLRDLLALAAMPTLPKALLIPKVCNQRDLNIIASILGNSIESCWIFALLETPEGISNASSIANNKYVDALMFGSADWSSECGCDMSNYSLQTPRSQIVQAAAQAGIVALDGAWLDFNDETGLQRESLTINNMGFCGKPVLHPKQIAAVHDAFMPDESAINFASSVLSAFEKDRDGVLLVNGRMIDKPVVKAAQRTMQLANAPVKKEKS